MSEPAPTPGVRTMPRIETPESQPLNVSRNRQLSVEQQTNLYHLLSQVLAYRVPGEVVEIGPSDGAAAMTLQGVLDAEALERTPFRVIDTRQDYRSITGDQSGQADRRAGPARVLSELMIQHFKTTVIDVLPTNIRFANVNFCQGLHRASQTLLMIWLLDNIYPRLSPGAVVSVIDYWHPNWHQDKVNVADGVQPALQFFLSDKEECLTVLPGGSRTHAYFRKRR